MIQSGDGESVIKHLIMVGEGFFIYFASHESRFIYPHNSPEDFTIQLPDRIQLRGTWLIALADVQYTVPPGESCELLIQCNLCDMSIVGNHKLPILRRLVTRQQGHYDVIFPKLYYCPLKMYEFDTVQVYINNSLGEKASFLQGSISGTLHFKQVE